MRNIVISTFLLASGLVSAEVSVVNLTTQYRVNPLGLDEQPMIGWQIKSDVPGTEQTAYRIVASNDSVSLNNGDYIYDSGFIQGDVSVQIPYKGLLKPNTRYYFKVKIRDNRSNESSFSRPGWFETGFLGTDGWKGADWIESDSVLLSRYRSSYILKYTADNPSTFIFGYRSPDDYNVVELNGDSFIIGHFSHGKYTQDGKEQIPDMKAGTKSEVELNVFASQYCAAYMIDPTVNGNKVINTHKDPKKEPKTLLEKALAGRQAEFKIEPQGSELPFYDARLYKIGYKVSGKQIPVSNISIISPAWGTVLYSVEKPSDKRLDNKAIVVWQPGDDISAPMFRKDIKVKKGIKNARLYATARGIYDFYINGKRITEDIMNPGWMDYRFRNQYNTFDVTDLLKQGDNSIGAILGNGWWSDFMGYQTYWQDQYGVKQSLKATLVVEYSDGTSDTFVTDKSWKCFNHGPITGNSIQNGEDFDARKEVDGWCKPGFRASAWNNVRISKPDSAVRMMAYVGDPVTYRDTIVAKSVRRSGNNRFIYDMGVNMVGIPQISFHGEKGQEIKVRYAEMLWPDSIPSNPVAPYTKGLYIKNKGQLYTDNYRSALSTDSYVCKGGLELIEPRFTHHGYRFIEIDGLEQELPLEDVKGLVVHSMAGIPTAYIETSDPLVNQLFQNILWGQRGNFLAVPTDCPQRDERLGYTGDGQVFATSAMFNYQVAPFYNRWLYTVRDNQDSNGNFADFSPKVDNPGSDVNGNGVIGWSDAGIIIPWNLYCQYGDKAILETQYPAMSKYMKYLEGRAEKHLQPAGGLGDWLGFEETNSQIINTSFYAYDARIMSKIAEILGLAEDTAHYNELFKQIKKDFNDTFVREDGQTFTPAGFKKGKWFPKTIDADELENTQASYVMPLMAGLFDNPELAVKHLCDNISEKDNHLATGFISTPFLAPILSDYGQADVAYDLFLNRTFPSWLYPVTQGATTMWERWNSYTKENGFGPVNMNSFNHYAYGAIEQWMMQYMLGLKHDPEHPGYKHFFIKPNFTTKMDYAKGFYDSVYGRIELGWARHGDTWEYSVTIPANTTATLVMGGENKELKSGKYTFTTKKI